MITTNTGAKKLESSDNWREIFPNPGTGAAGAHNASVDAADRIQPEIAPIINGKQCALGASAGDFVLLRNSTITGKADGAYQAAKAIPANTDIDATYLGSEIGGGIANALNANLTSLFKKTTATTAANITSGYSVNDGAGLNDNLSGYTVVAISPNYIADDVVVTPFGINNGRVRYRLVNTGSNNYGVKTVSFNILAIRNT